MTTDHTKAKIYLSALLHHIPNESVGERFRHLVASSTANIEGILARADQYALTKSGSIASTFSFVGSPFENLKKHSTGGTRKYDYKIPALPLSLERGLFPSIDYSPNEERLVDLWKDFNGELEYLEWSADNQIKVTSEAVLDLLFKYATAIPNPSNINQEVSWYDYAKMKAGLAVCLFDYLSDEKGDLNTVVAEDEKPILIIRADLSGIQSFIYDIASKQASKNLKGRSFYVQLLSDAVLIKMLETFDLYQGNVMYASGGNFFVIAPNTKKVKDAFEGFEHKITKAIFHQHGSRISLVMGYQEVSQGEIFNGKINLAIKSLFEEKIDRNKKRKFSSLIQENYSKFFDPSDVGGEVATDIITGEEISASEENIFKVIENSSLPQKASQRDIEEGTDLIKGVTAKQIFLGHNLKDVNYLIVTPERLELDVPKADELMVNPAELGLNFYTVKSDGLNEFERVLRTGSVYKVFAINEPRPRDFFLGKKVTVHSSMFYGGNKAPIVKEAFENDRGETRRVNSPKYFDELAGEKEGYFRRLAVLKMDVDGLGGTFKDVNFSGLTFSYYAALSRHLDWFFKGYLNTLWENNAEFREYTQIIYSGGDDLFIIGRWNTVIDFAELIHKEFNHFACADKLAPQDRVTISGGISIVTDKFPIMKAAAFADEAEKAAKQHQLVWTEEEKIKWPQKGYSEFRKNSINLFGKSLHWGSEYLLVKELKDELVKYVSPSDNPKLGLPKSLLGKIQQYASMAEKYEQEKQFYELEKKRNPSTEIQPPSPRWIWNVVYDFSRFVERVKDDNKSFMKKLRDKVDENIKSYLKSKINVVDKIQRAIFINKWDSDSIESSYHFIQLLSLAARWAELEIRSNQNKTQYHD